jgi:hypothetical protein
MQRELLLLNLFSSYAFRMTTTVINYQYSESNGSNNIVVSRASEPSQIRGVLNVRPSHLDSIVDDQHRNSPDLGAYSASLSRQHRVSYFESQTHDDRPHQILPVDKRRRGHEFNRCLLACNTT